MATYPLLKGYMGSNLIKARKKLGLNQQSIADALSLTRVQVANMESGASGMTVESVFILCDFLKITPNDLFPTKEQLKDYKPMSKEDRKRERLKVQIESLQEKLSSLTPNQNER